MLNLPFFDELEKAQNILLAGAGGGFDEGIVAGEGRHGDDHEKRAGGVAGGVHRWLRASVPLS